MELNEKQIQRIIQDIKNYGYVDDEAGICWVLPYKVPNNRLNIIIQKLTKGHIEWYETETEETMTEWRKNKGMWVINYPLKKDKYVYRTNFNDALRTAAIIAIKSGMNVKDIEEY